MVRLLVRSRKVEIDLISKQFGSLIDQGFLTQMKADLDDLIRSLNGPSKGEE